MTFLGIHLLIEMYDCNSELLNNPEYVQSVLVQSAEHAGATVVSNSIHKFNPHGVSGAVVIAESHVTIHTWPEYNYAAVDVFTCSNTVSPWSIVTEIEEKLECKTSKITDIHRGII